MKCLKCGYIGIDYDFITMYDYDSKFPIYICPRCFNVASDEIIEEKSCKE